MLHPFLPDTVYHTYGDAAYPHLPRWLKWGGRRNQGALQDNQGQQAAYMILSRSRITVEWGFGQIVNLWRFIDYKRNNKLFLQPLRTYYRVMGFLTNCHKHYTVVKHPPTLTVNHRHFQNIYLVLLIY